MQTYMHGTKSDSGADPISQRKKLDSMHDEITAKELTTLHVFYTAVIRARVVVRKLVRTKMGLRMQLSKCMPAAKKVTAHVNQMK